MLDPDMSENEALAYWMGGDKGTFVAEEHGVVLRTYYICDQFRPVAGDTFATAGTWLTPRLPGAGLREPCASIR
jgi:hypothetical protein